MKINQFLSPIPLPPPPRFAAIGTDPWVIALLKSPLLKFPAFDPSAAEEKLRLGKAVMTSPCETRKAGEGNPNQSLQVTVRELEGLAPVGKGKRQVPASDERLPYPPMEDVEAGRAALAAAKAAKTVKAPAPNAPNAPVAPVAPVALLPKAPNDPASVYTIANGSFVTATLLAFFLATDMPEIVLNLYDVMPDIADLARDRFLGNAPNWGMDASFAHFIEACLERDDQTKHLIITREAFEFRHGVIIDISDHLDSVFRSYMSFYGKFHCMQGKLILTSNFICLQENFIITPPSPQSTSTS